MSVDSGRRLGRISSLINISVPVITVIMYITYFFSLILSISTRTTPSTASAMPIVLIIALVTLGIITFVGFIMFIVAMYKLSNYYKEPKIFTNILYAVILSLVGGASMIAIIFGFLFTSITPFIGQPSSTSSSFFLQFVLAIGAIVVGALVLGIVSGLLYMRAFNRLADRSGVDGFKTAGILYLVGVIVPIVGWIAWILAYMGFSQLKPTQIYSYTPAPTGPIIGFTKRCPNCGIENTQDSLFCRNCGKPL